MFSMISHHDTTNLQPEELKLAELRAVKLETHIHNLFKARWNENISPPSVKRYLDKTLGQDTLLTSVRRGISNLTNQGLLEKTDAMADGGHGMGVHCWRLKMGTDLFGDSENNFGGLKQ